MVSVGVAVRAAVEARAVIGKNRIQKSRIKKAIEFAEKGTSGEIRVHLSYRDGETEILKHAEHCFHALGMTQTRHRNAVLLYVNPKMKKFALFGDQGIHDSVGQDFWSSLASQVTCHIREKNLSAGIVHAVEAIGKSLKEHFPHETDDQNELPGDVTES